MRWVPAVVMLAGAAQAQAEPVALMEVLLTGAESPASMAQAVQARFPDATVTTQSFADAWQVTMGLAPEGITGRCAADAKEMLSLSCSLLFSGDPAAEQMAEAEIYDWVEETAGFLELAERSESAHAYVFYDDTLRGTGLPHAVRLGRTADGVFVEFAFDPPSLDG